MHIEAKFRSQGKTFKRLINTDTYLYMDEHGVLFSEGNHAKFADGEYTRVRAILDGAHDMDEVRLLPDAAAQ
jgi:hypothetical protein